jgi:hypothetical protein
VSWVDLVLLSLASPLPSPTPQLTCEWVAKGEALRATTKTLIQVRPYCRDEPMTREAMIESMACEDQTRELVRQIRRLSPRFAADRVTVVDCPAAVRIAVEGEDGTMTSIPLTDRKDFFGTVLLAPKRRPARILGPIADEEFLDLIKEYFR